MSKCLENRKILMVIAPEQFRDEEYEIPFSYFRNEGAYVMVTSTTHGVARGMFGRNVSIERSIDEIDEKEFDAVVFVGGAGTPTVRSSHRAIEIAQHAAERGVVAAICWAPTLLAKADLLRGRNATVWNGDDAEYNKTTPEVLQHYGAHFVDKSVVADGNIVTGNGPDAAELFAREVADCICREVELSPCSHAPNAEGSRPMEDEKPCDDGRGQNL